MTVVDVECWNGVRNIGKAVSGMTVGRGSASASELRCLAARRECMTTQQLHLFNGIGLIRLAHRRRPHSSHAAGRQDPSPRPKRLTKSAVRDAFVEAEAVQSAGADKDGQLPPVV